MADNLGAVEGTRAKMFGLEYLRMNGYNLIRGLPGSNRCIWIAPIETGRSRHAKREERYLLCLISKPGTQDLGVKRRPSLERDELDDGRGDAPG